MKRKAVRNLQEYGTDEHIFGVGMAVSKKEKPISQVYQPQTTRAVRERK